MSFDDATWGRIYKRALDHALGRLRYFRLRASLEDAQQIAQDGLEGLLTQIDEVQDERAALERIGSIINGLTINLSRKKSSRQERLLPDAIDAATSDLESPETVLSRKQEAGARLDALLELLKPHPVAEQVLLARITGADKPAEIAKLLNIEVQLVYRANRVIEEKLTRVHEGTS